MHLSDLSPGNSARVLAFEGGSGFGRQLALRGLAEGRIVPVLSGSFGPVVVRIAGETLVLGRGAARKVRVQTV
ncbi:ferrous iron transport protein A [Methanoculleus sp. FWC-SCC1]|uniref:Ferrous iron transport protein A n=1 Tax=Methanoculleus frigidifontis TaxID=2584085 RepID=A0ABT8M8Q2_9EURY|nr:FeoA family protein [Methanoculleus sp. FWC-SCC1]MDN7024324.1 ferrous iron transport protein A [Methanoculleus sp. FWC-SCC1]